MDRPDNSATRLQPPFSENEVQDDATRLFKPQNDDATRLVPRQDRVENRRLPLPEHRIAQPGTLIENRFRLEREIGQGGMGVVYAARDLVQEEVGETDSIIAIKLLSDDFKAHPEALRMLLQETKKARDLAHPNIVKVFEFYHGGDSDFMTMELLTGRSLEEYMDEHEYKPANFDDVIPIVKDMAHGLDYAHKRNIVHSDLKPANIHLTDDGAKILDFGIARAVIESERTETCELVALTPSYASLEMFLGEPPDPRDDIYALACLTYQLLTGEHPYARYPANKALERGMVAKRIDGLKDRQWAGLLSGLALKRKDRVKSAGEFLEALLPKRREPWKAISAVLAVVAVVSAGYFLTKPPQIVEPNLFENPPPAATLPTTQQLRVNELLELAEVHFLVGRLLSPPGSNALDEYRKVLELHPYDRQAIAGIKTVLDELAQQALNAVESGNRQRAKLLVEEGLKVHKDHKQLLKLKGMLDNVNVD